MECTHGPCTCMVEQADGHCSEACAELAGVAEGCPCQHPGCEGTPVRPSGPDDVGVPVLGDDAS